MNYLLLNGYMEILRCIDCEDFVAAVRIGKRDHSNDGAVRYVVEQNADGKYTNIRKVANDK